MSRKRRDLRGMVVAISGASAGIGAALAEQLAPAGARLALCARRVDRLEEINRKLGGGHLVVRADVASTSGKAAARLASADLVSVTRFSSSWAEI